MPSMQMLNKLNIYIFESLCISMDCECCKKPVLYPAISHGVCLECKQEQNIRFELGKCVACNKPFSKDPRVKSVQKFCPNCSIEPLWIGFENCHNKKIIA